MRRSVSDGPEAQPRRSARPLEDRASSHLLDVHALAEVLCVTPRHIQRLVAERRIPYLKVGRFVRFDPAELDGWLDAQRVEMRQPALRATGAR